MGRMTAFCGLVTAVVLTLGPASAPLAGQEAGPELFGVGLLNNASR